MINILDISKDRAQKKQNKYRCNRISTKLIHLNRIFLNYFIKSDLKLHLILL